MTISLHHIKAIRDVYITISFKLLLTLAFQGKPQKLHTKASLHDVSIMFCLFCQLCRAALFSPAPHHPTPRFVLLRPAAVRRHNCDPRCWRPSTGHPSHVRVPQSFVEGGETTPTPRRWMAGLAHDGSPSMVEGCLSSGRLRQAGFVVCALTNNFAEVGGKSTSPTFRSVFAQRPTFRGR